jgi:large conductance mechanosensitive channel
MAAFFDEFRDFIKRGNVVDLAIGLIMGAAFGKIVSSFVADILMPPVGLLVGGINFGNLKIVIGGNPEAPATINYGQFIQTVLDFVIVSFCVFLLVKGVNALHRRQDEKPPEPTAQEKLLAEIRDLLKAQQQAPAK